MTFPSVPDNLYKLLIFLGLVIIGYAFFENQKSAIVYNNDVNDLNSSIDSLTLKQLTSNYKRDKIKRKSEILTDQNNIKNPLLITDTSYAFHFAYSTKNPKEVFLDSTFNVLVEEIKDVDFELSIQNKLIALKKDGLNGSKQVFKEYEEQLGYVFATGFLLFLVGLIGLMWQQRNMDEILKNQVNENGKYYEYCQSCGKLFSAVRAFGRNKDGQPNKAFCNKCYDNGCFTEPDLSFEEFLKKVDFGKKGRFNRKILLNRFKNLDRWNKDRYY